MQENLIHLGFHMTPSPTYFPSFSTVIGLLPELAATDSADLGRK